MVDSSNPVFNYNKQKDSSQNQKQKVLLKTTIYSTIKPENFRFRALCCRTVFSSYKDGDLAGNRTRDCAVRGRRLNLLTTRPYSEIFCSAVAEQFGLYHKLKTPATNFTLKLKKISKKRYPPVPQSEKVLTRSRRWEQADEPRPFRAKRRPRLFRLTFVPVVTLWITIFPLSEHRRHQNKV